jgi:hypothetical protein
MNNAVTRVCAWVSFALLTYAPLAAAQTTEVVAGARDFLDVAGTTVATDQTSMSIAVMGTFLISL